VFGIEELDPVGIDEVPVVFTARLFVMPGLRALAAFEIDARAFAKVFANDLGSATESLHRKPLCMLLQLAIPVSRAFAGGDA